MFKGILAGLGGRGMGWYRDVDDHDSAEWVAFVEPSEANRKRAIEKLGVDETQLHPTLEEAIDAVDADWVCDVTPPAVHHEIAQTAFAAGLHVLGEKPLSDRWDIAKQVVEHADKVGVKHMITQNYRFGPSPRTMRQLVKEGRIGKPGQFDIRFYMNWADAPGSHYVTQPYMLLNDMMVHHFDMMRFVVGLEPKAVTAITWNHPWGWHQGDAAHAIVFEFPDGLHGTHVAVGCAIGQTTSWNGDWRLEGDRGSLTLENEQIRHVWKHRAPEPIDEQLPALEVPPPGKAMLDEFFASIREDREPECSSRDNLHSVAMVFAAIESARQGRRVELSELG